VSDLIFSYLKNVLSCLWSLATNIKNDKMCLWPPLSVEALLLHMSQSPPPAADRYSAEKHMVFLDCRLLVIFTANYIEKYGDLDH